MQASIDGYIFYVYFARAIEKLFLSQFKCRKEEPKETHDFIGKYVGFNVKYVPDLK